MRRNNLLWGVILILAILCLQASAPAPELHGQPLLARIAFSDRTQLARLVSQVDVWEAHPGEGWALAYLTLEQLKFLTQTGWQVQVDQARSAELNQPIQTSPTQLAGIPGYACYRTVEESFTTIASLAAAYPNLTEVQDLGDSYEKAIPGGSAGYDILALRITNKLRPGTKPRFFLMAETHAREYTTSETALRLAEYLLAHYGSDAEVTWLLDHQEIYILPFTNPDGRKKAEAGNLWRKNTQPYGSCSSTSFGVDLNRNSSFKWGGDGSSGAACSETYRGPLSASEPETQAFQTKLAALFPDRRGSADADPAPDDYEGLFITLHSYGQLILWPWGWTSASAPNFTQLQSLGRKLAFFNGYTPQRAAELYATSGTNEDWAYGELGMPSFVFEMGTSFFQDCSSFESTIYPANRDALLYAFKAARRPYQTPAAPEVFNPGLSKSVARPGETVTLTATADDTRSTAGEPAQAISAARYSIDLPSWAPGATLHALSAADGSWSSSVEALTATLSTGGLALGRYTLFIEARGADGIWGVPTATFLTIQGLNLYLPVIIK